MSTPPATPGRARAAVATTLAVGLFAAVLTACGTSSNAAGGSSTAASNGGSSAAGASASTAAATASGSASTGCITDYRAGTDYFPTKISTTDASNFTIAYHDSYAVVTVKKPNPTSGAESYVLLRCGAPKPTLTGSLATAQVISVPVRTVEAVSVTQIASLELLHSVGDIVGVGSPDGVTSSTVQAGLKSGSIADISSSTTDFDLEKAAAAKAQLMFQSGMANPSYAKLRTMGTPTVADGSWLEATPLGRAEWIKYYSVFLGQEQLANQQYATIRASYEKTLASVKTAASRPTVLVGAEFQGTWSVPNGDAYVANYVKDAGGSYVFSSLKGTGTTQLDTEKVITAGQKATIWINGNWMSLTRWRTKADALKDEPRLTELPAFQSLQVWNPTKRISSNGANDYWETGVVRPDLVLADLAQIFHPDLAQGRQLYFYQQLKA